jgi:hypothetical protein
MIITKARASLIALAVTASVAIGAAPLASTASAKPRRPNTPAPSAQSKQTMCNALWSDFSSNVNNEEDAIDSGNLAAANTYSDNAAADMRALRAYGCIA